MDWETIRHHISVVSLGASVVALPFSVTFCHGAVIIFLITWLAGGQWKEKWRIFKGNFPLHLIILFFFIHLAGLAYTENIDDGFFDIEKKIFMVLVPVAVVTSRDTGRKERLLILSLFTAVCFFSTLYCLYHASGQLHLLTEGDIRLRDFNYLAATSFAELHPDESGGWMLFSYVALASGIGLHPTYFSLYIAFCIIFLIHLLTDRDITKKKIHRIALWILIFYFWFFVMMLASRIVIIALLVISIFLMFSMASDKSLFRRLAIVFASSFLLFMSVNPVLKYRAWQELSQSSYTVTPSGVYSVSTEIRNSLWWLSWKSLEHTNLIWGNGTGAAQHVIDRTNDRFDIKNTLNTNDPHNQYFETLISHGLPGLSVLLMILVLPSYLAWRRGDLLTFCFCVLMLITCITESALSVQKGILFFSVFYSLLISQYSDYKFSLFSTKTVVISEGTQQP